MSRTSRRAGTKSEWRRRRTIDGKPQPYGAKAVKNHKEKS